MYIRHRYKKKKGIHFPEKKSPHNSSFFLLDHCSQQNTNYMFEREADEDVPSHIQKVV